MYGDIKCERCGGEIGAAFYCRGTERLAGNVKCDVCNYCHNDLDSLIRALPEWRECLDMAARRLFLEKSAAAGDAAAEARMAEYNRVGDELDKRIAVRVRAMLPYQKKARVAEADEEVARAPESLSK